MIVLGGRKYGRITQEQVDQIKARCQTETRRSIGKSIGLAEQRVGEVVKVLGIVTPSRRGIFLKPFEALYHVLLGEVRRRPLRFSQVDLSYEEFLEFTSIKKCHYCGENLQWSERINREVMSYTGYNLDRKDSSLGYTKENCVACCGDCNRTKGDRFSYEEFKLIATTIRYVLHIRKLKDKE